MRTISALILLFGFAVTPNAQASPLDGYSIEERWDCYRADDRSRTVPLYIVERWTPDYGDDIELGKVRTSSNEEIGIFEFEGTDRRWSYELDDDDETFLKSIIMRPNGDAAFYDFSNAEIGEAVQPSQMLVCRESRRLLVP